MSFKTAVILAAGSGTRMLPLTSNMPKALVEVGGKSLIRYQIEMLRGGGVENIYVTYGHMGEKLISSIRDEVDGFIDTSGRDNAYFLSTDGVVSRNEPVIVCPCDMIAKIDFQDLFNDYTSIGSPAACIVPVPGSANADSIDLDVNIIKSISRGGPGVLSASGIQILNPDKISKVAKAPSNFYDVWSELIANKMLYCSNVFPDYWKVFDTQIDVSSGV